jgi:adenylate cyclase
MAVAASPEAFEEIKPLLDGMPAIRNDDKLIRDIWLSPALQQEHGIYRPIRAPQILNAHPHAIPNIASRLYPIIYGDNGVACETAPLAIARAAWNIPRGDAKAITTELVRSGIIAKWHEMAPTAVAKSEEPKSDYAIGEHSVSWHAFQPVLPLVPPAAFWVCYESPIDEYERLSYVDVLQGDASQAVKDKIVIIGFSADIDPTSDVYAIPSTIGKASAAEVVAYATQTLLDSRSMQEVPAWIYLVIGTLMILACAIIAGLSKPLHAIAGVLLMLMLYYAGAIVAYRSDWFSDFLLIPSIALATAVAGGAMNAWVSLRARQRIIDMFGRYVPRAIVNQLVQRNDLRSLMLGGLSREVTVMFADVRGFTDFSQDLAPEAVVRELNSLLEKMVECTFEHEGTLDKFIGDAILVLFNAPLNQPDHSLRAVRTAISIQKQLANHPSGLRIGVGVHRGTAVVGNIGTPERMEYTAIGSTVNIASRLCDQAAAGEIVISQAVIDHLGNGFPLGEISSVQVKGIKSALSVARIKVD